ncbi:cytochrome C oxidase subunit IV family protein [Mycobacterium sp. MYCO198283]|uniref:cytochrome C oxidase subunit IV family protein n=1 Tax=Mycobacterium sp. MYCO198283 TaxID=2883505 RepID=UPI001E39C947|nr:cytochrome C oxidase subunit IV family protein [Mycobacterium sp. MYCO198283]MCG5434168.1 cytochrome C oxidase subunit IV family protein [Mycobacterium sp. MYCO198283]
MTTSARLTAAWALLSAVTVLSWWLAGHGGSHATTAVTLGVLGIALVKVRVIMRSFMEVRRGPRWLRVTADGWLVAFFATVLALCLG